MRGRGGYTQADAKTEGGHKLKLTRLFQPITVNGMALKNRVVMPALHHLYTPDGYATPRFNEYYWRRAEGGAGLVFTGGCRFDDYGGAPAMMSLQTDDFIAGYKEFTDGMHARGAKVGVQLYHAGAYAHSVAIPGGRKALAPSAVFSKFTKEMPKEMTVDELKEIVRNWAAGALRAKKAGFDVVEIIASAGYLISQFLSPLKNLRTDEYGGPWENRTRFAREVMEAVRAAVGPDYPVCMRVAGNDFVPNSNTNENAVEFCVMMERAGVDMFNVTGGWHESVVPQITGDLPRGGFSYLAAAIKDAVGIPVAVSNRINDPVLAEKLLAFGAGDLICVGRPHIADPDWTKKAESGAFDEIRKCLACNQGCLAKTFFMKPIECLVNGIAGREYLFKDARPSVRRKILVVGGGPAGCEFAVRASGLGHDVTLWEKGADIGGQIDLASAPPGKSEFDNLPAYFRAMLKKNGVAVVCGKDARADEIVGAGFDLVVTATGSLPKSVPLPAKTKIPVYSAYDVLRDEAIPGRNVVVLGGGSVGCETAQYLAHDAGASPEQIYFLLAHDAESTETVRKLVNSTRRTVTVVDAAKIGAGFDPGTGWPVLKDLARFGVKQYPLSKITAMDDESVTITAAKKDSPETAEVRIPCDAVVIAVGAFPDDSLFKELTARGVAVKNIGDSEKVGKVLDAVRAADDLAFSL
jgi:2,4-dienoyl-CoA reductase (NADPH2)